VINMVYDTSKLIGPIVGMAGAAIGIGLLSKTAQNISKMNKPIKYKRKQQRKMKFKMDNYWGV